MLGKIKKNSIRIIAAIVLSAIFGALLALFNFDAKILHQINVLESMSPILISKEMVLPQANGGILYLPQNWSRNEVQKISGATVGVGFLSHLSLDSDIVRVANGRYQRVTVLDIGKEILSVLAPTQPCRPGIIFKLTDTSYSNSTESGWLGIQRVRIGTLPKTNLLDALAPNISEPLVVKCSHDEASSSKIIFIPNSGAEVVALDILKSRLIASGEYDRSGIIQSRISIEPLSDLVSKQVESRFAWLKILTVGFIFLSCIIIMSIALFDAIKIRGDYSVMRAIGSSMRNIFLNSLRRMLIFLLPPLVLSVVALSLVSMCLSRQLLNMEYMYWAQITLWVFGTVAVCILCHYFYAVSGIDSRVTNSTSIAGGKFKNLSIATSITLLALTTTLFTLFAFSMNKYSNKIRSMSLGYNPVGLYITELVPKLDVNSGAQAASLAALSSAVTQLQVQNESIALACNIPWSLDTFNMDARFSSIATFVEAGPGIATVLQIRVNGRDLQQSDSVSSNAQLVQSLDMKFADSAKVFGKTVGKIEGVVSGALVPMKRNMLFRMMRNDQCNYPLLLQRPSSLNKKTNIAKLTSNQLRISTSANGYVFSEPKDVASIIAGYREPVERIRIIANYGIIAAFISAFLLVLNTCASFIDLHLRTFAIKNALGQSSIQSALFVTKNILKFALLGVIVAAFVWPYLELAVLKLFDFIPKLQLLDIIVVALSIMVIIGILSFLISMLRFRKLDLVTALRIE